MKLRQGFYLFLWIVASICNIPAQAEVVPLEMFINNMVTKHNFDKQALTQLFKKAKVKNSILKVMSRPAGKRRPWYRYRENFVTKKRINGGVDFWRTYANTLQRAKSTYGVPPEIIIAIIGVETIYGGYTGNNRIIDALKTLSFHYPKRADFFRKELEAFLLVTREEGFDPLEMKGSYAGAMGLGQFMPTSYQNYAVDFDGDGQRNIWTNVVDAIGSVANYFKQHQWQPGQPVLLAVQVDDEIAGQTLVDLEFKPQYSMPQLKKMGLRKLGNQYDDYSGLVFDLETEQGKLYWVGFNNFYVITRYNRSTRYAMAVYQLAQEIKSAYEDLH